MNNKNIIQWLCFLCIFIGTNCVKKSSIFTHVPRYDGLKCTNPPFEQNLAFISCTSICLGRSDCVGVFYSLSTSLCTGCYTFDDNHVQGAASDSKYFHSCFEADNSGNYGGSYYTVFSTNSLFIEAKYCCAAKPNSAMVHLENSNEEEFVSNLVKAISVDAYWVGLQYDTTVSRWKWVDDNTEPGFTKWYPGSPNNLPVQGCVVWQRPFGEAWDNIECQRFRPFVCEQRNN